MTRLIGSDSNFGFFATQELTPDSVVSEFNLDYKVATPSGLLVVYNNLVQQPNVDYALTDGGQKIVFNFVPTSGLALFIIYLGRELSVAAVAGQELLRERFIGDNIETNFPLPVSHVLVEEGILVFVDGEQKHYSLDWTLDNNTKEIIFGVPPAGSAVIDVHIFGVQRNDITAVADGSITKEKLNLEWDFNGNDDFYPKINNTRDLGTSSFRVRKGYFVDGDFLGDIIIQGSLDVQGTLTTINTAELDVDDNEITLNSNFTSGSPSLNGGIQLLRGDDPSAKLEWNESADKWTAGITGSTENILTQTDLDDHLAASNPHGITKSDVGLGSVTNDAQLKRAGGDFSTFTNKASPVGADVLLIEDSADSNNKKYVTITDLPYITGTLSNNTFLKWRNAADDADLNVLKVDGSDNTVLNALTGKEIQLQINEVTLITIDSSGNIIPTNDTQVLGSLSNPFSGAVIKNDSSLLFENNAGSGLISALRVDTGDNTLVRADSHIIFYPNQTVKFRMQDASDSILGFYSNAQIIAETSDASDTLSVIVAGGGAGAGARGAYLKAHGNEFVGGQGQLHLQAGDTGFIRLGVQAGTWRLTQSGHLEPQVDGNFDIGSVTNSIRTLYVDDIVGGHKGTDWSSISANQTLDINSGYIVIGSASELELALPSTSAVGTTIEITSADANGFKITQSAGQNIRFGSSVTTTGATGELSATQQGDSIKLICVVADTSWNVISSIGNFQVV